MKPVVSLVCPRCAHAWPGPVNETCLFCDTRGVQDEAA